jgi:drug/metabolite transporter (DMT)-like permease
VCHLAGKEINVKSQKEFYTAIVVLILTVILWGLSFISTKVLLNYLTPALIAFSRQLIALVPLSAAMYITKSFKRPAAGDLKLIAVSGLLGIVLYFLFENTGMKYTTASNASIIVAAVPVLTLISEIAFFNMKLNFRILACIFTSIGGVYLVISNNGRLDFSSSTLKGNLLIIGAMVCWVSYTIINKKLDYSKYNPLVMVFYQTLSAAILFLPFVIQDKNHWQAIPLSAVANLLYLGVLCSALAYIMFNYSSQKLGPTISSTFLNLTPVVSVTAGFFLLGEVLSATQLAGMILIIGSLFVISKK